MAAAKVGEIETRSNREDLLRDFVRFSWRASRGLTTAAEAEGKELIRRMVEIGRITTDEGDRLEAALMSRMGLSRENFEKRVDAGVRRAVERIGEISAREISRMSEQTASLEKRLATLLEKKQGK